MMIRAKRGISRLTRSLATLPLRLLSSNARAQLLETLSEEMIVTTTVPSGIIHFYAPSPLLRFRAATILSKEPDTIQWIDRFCDGDVFWDIGANVGVYSLYAAVRKKTRVFAFEPSATNFHVLARNIHLNRLSDRVTAYCIAFSQRTRLGVLNLSTVQMGGSLSQFGEIGERSRYVGNADGAVHGMLGMAIDDFVTEFAPTFPNCLKIDVDGLELPILQGATKTLFDQRLRSLMVELNLTNESENKQALQLLAECGWRLVSRGEVQGSLTEKAANHLFERKS